jgi:hypothetical protein
MLSLVNLAGRPGCFGSSLKPAQRWHADFLLAHTGRHLVEEHLRNLLVRLFGQLAVVVKEEFPLPTGG